MGLAFRGKLMQARSTRRGTLPLRQVDPLGINRTVTRLSVNRAPLFETVRSISSWHPQVTRPCSSPINFFQPVNSLSSLNMVAQMDARNRALCLMYRKPPAGQVSLSYTQIAENVFNKGGGHPTAVSVIHPTGQRTRRVRPDEEDQQERPRTSACETTRGLRQRTRVEVGSAVEDVPSGSW